MATTYKSPGVYIEEISKFPPSVAQVETAVPAFIGYTEKAQKNGAHITNVPTRINSMIEFESWFGGPDPVSVSVTLLDQIDENNNNALLNRSITSAIGSPTPYLMHYGIQLYFANGGGPCYVISVGGYNGSIKKVDISNGLGALEKEDEPTLIAFPDATGLIEKDFHAVMVEALMQCDKLQDRFTICDTYSDDLAAIDKFRNGIGTSYLHYGASYYPYLRTSLNYQYQEDSVIISHQTTDSKGTSKAGGLDKQTLAATKDQHNESYESIKSELRKLTVKLPPCTAMAGIYARVDGDRGVWKAPANVSVNGVIGPSVKITNDIQDGLNIDPTSGKSINAIRAFWGKGTLVWGARTLAGNDNEWRYVNVRRFFSMVEESVKKSTSWAVFESNNANTWVRVSSMIENYLTGLWRQGALAGPTPEKAFYVKVGLGTTMTTQDILEGRMNIEIGMAVARPAEFIVLKFSHKLQEV